MGHCEIDKHAQKSYNALFDTKGEWFCEDATKINYDTLPEFDLLCAGFPCQSFSVAGKRLGFDDTRGTMFFELAKLARYKKPPYILLENVAGLLSHEQGKTFSTMLSTLQELGYHLEWQVLNSADFNVPQARKRVYIIGYLDERCRGKIFPFTDANPQTLKQIRGGSQGKRIYDADGLSITITASAGGKGGKTGLYLPIKENTKIGFKNAFEGDSIDLAYATKNSRRGRVGDKIAHTITTSSSQGTLHFIDLNVEPKVTELSRCLHTRQDNGLHNHKGECSGVLVGDDTAPIFKGTDGKIYQGRIRKLTPRECLRLQGYTDDRIDVILSINSDAQAYKQAGNGVTVTVVEAIGKRLFAMHEEISS